MTNPINTKDGTWDIAPVGWTPDWAGGAARSVFQPQFTYDGTHQTYNYTDYNNPKANELAQQAINATTPEEVGKLWGQVDELVMADAPVIPLIANKIVLYHGEAVQNFQPYALGVARRLDQRLAASAKLAVAAVRAPRDAAGPRLDARRMTDRWPVLEVAASRVEIPTEDGIVHAVQDVSFSVEAGELFGIAGESGSGKSVLTQAIMGLLPNAEITGEVLVRRPRPAHAAAPRSADAARRRASA